MAIKSDLLFKQALKRANRKCEFCGVEDVKATKDSSKLLSLVKLNRELEYSLDNSGVLCSTCKYRLEDLNDIEVEEFVNELRHPKTVEENRELPDIVKCAFLKSEEFENCLINEVKKINNRCKKKISEASKAVTIETGLGTLLRMYNIDYVPEKEGIIKIVNDETILIKRNTKKITNKRFDSRFHEVITEYKVDIINNLESNKEQLKEYIEALSKTEKNDNYFGVLTDGNHVVFISVENGIWEESGVRPFNVQSMKELLRVYLSLERKKFTPEQLVEDFSLETEDSPILNLTKILYRRLEGSKEVHYHKDWQRIFKLAGHNDNNNLAILKRKQVLSERFGINIDQLDETKALFTLQTSYCIIIKLIAYKTLQMTVLNDLGVKFEELEKLQSNILRSQISYIENGESFKQLNIHNLLDKDFFSWYLEDEIWNQDIAEALQVCIGILKDYDINQRIFAKEITHDLFNNLYQSIIPKEVRHSLGEYYTMDWLADSVLEGILEKPAMKIKGWRGLDPCCGSGTFVMRMVNKIIEEYTNEPEKILENILSRVAGMDINPLAVLTCSVNYFIAIAPYLSCDDLIKNNKEIRIPIILGDAALKPKTIKVGEVECISYNFNEMEFKIPTAIISKPLQLDKIEKYVHECNIIKLKKEFLLHPEDSYTKDELEILDVFLNNLLELVKQTDNKIWVRTIISILKCENLGHFDVIISNPPWIDWKVLPDEYREILKVACIEKHVFSGDNYTGGINLNICALIANVIADNWLNIDGYMGLLMPKSIAYQQSYKGFRNLEMTQGGYLNFDSFVDWSNAGKPFNPVTEKFMTYYFEKTLIQKVKEKIPCKFVSKKRGYELKNVKSFKEAKGWFDVKFGYAIIIDKELKNFLFIDERENLKYVDDYKKIVGKSYYTGRVGLGLYPKGRILFNVIETMGNEYVRVENNGGTKAQKEFIKDKYLLESAMLYPVIEGPDIKRFAVEEFKYVAPFPYTDENLKEPISTEKLEEMAPKLYKYYNMFKEDLNKTVRNMMLQGRKGAFYSLTRVGKYTFAPYKVAFRNNTRWVAAVVSNTKVPWDDEKMYLFLDHACSVSQREDGSYITEDEAHYICAILNSTIVKNYIENSSDSRSFKTVFPIKIVKFDEGDIVHQRLVEISKKAHAKELIGKQLDVELDETMHNYLNKL